MEKYQGSFDAVFDTHGRLSLGHSGAMLKRGGVALHLVPTRPKMMRSLFSRQHQTIFAKLTPGSMDAIVEAVEQHRIISRVGRTVLLSEAIQAIVELAKTSRPKGKLVIFPMRCVSNVR